MLSSHVLYVVLPNPYHDPTTFNKMFIHFFVSLFVAVYLVQPELRVRFRAFEVKPAPMPKAPVYEQRDLFALVGEVWIAKDALGLMP